MDGLSPAPSCKQERDAVASSLQVPSKEGRTCVCAGVFSKTAAILVTTLENEAPRDFPIRSSSAVPSFSTAIFKAFAKMNTLGSADRHCFVVVTFRQIRRSSGIIPRNWVHLLLLVFYYILNMENKVILKSYLFKISYLFLTKKKKKGLNLLPCGECCQRKN